MIGTTLSHYRIDAELGRGGMGVIYRATDTKLDRVVALKFLPPEMSADEDAKARFVQEAKAASALDHPNICTIYEIGESDDGKLFIAMSFYDGQTLKYLMEEGAMPQGKAAGIALQIADGLRTAHSAGITHRDIKPANIMVTSEGRVKILDFGLAKLGEGVDLTKAGSTVGTTAYMSPEQSSGKKVDGRTDLWALGVILYELLSGEKAFGGGYDQAVLYSVMNENPEPLEGIDPGLADVVDGLMKKNPDERIQSAQEVLTKLDPYASGSTRTVIQEQPVDRRSNTIGAIAAVVIVLALLSWIVIGPTGSDDSIETQKSGVVIFPFSIQGSDEYDDLREGMVSTLSRRLDGFDPFHTVDPNRILAKVDSDRESFFDPDESGKTVEELGGDQFVIGSVVQTGSQVELLASLYNLDGVELGSAQVVFQSNDDLPGAIDQLAIQLIRMLLPESERHQADLISPTTRSFVALQNLLRSEAALRDGSYQAALDFAEEAIRADSTLGTAWYFRARAYSWLNSSPAPYFDEVEPWKHTLPQRFRRLYETRTIPVEEQEASIRAFLRDYPGDLDGVGRLGDFIFHNYPGKYLSASNAIPFFLDVLELDPDNQEYQTHAVTQLLRDRREEEADSLIQSSGSTRFAGYAALASGDLSVLQELSEDELGVTMNRLALGEHWSLFLKVLQIQGNDLPPDLDFFLASLFGTHTDSLVQRFIDPDQLATDTSLGAVLISLHPEIRVDTTIFIDIDVQLMGWMTADDSLNAQRADELFLQPEDLDHVVLYMSALLNRRIGRQEIVADRADQLRANAGRLEGDSPAYFLSQRLDGILAFDDGENEQAVEMLTVGTRWVPMRGIARSFLSYDAIARSTRGEAQANLGRYQEAIASWRSLNDGFGGRGDILWLALSYEKRAQLYEQMGDFENAIEFYTRYIKLRENADSHLQPKVEQARERIDALLLRQLEEPQ